MIKKTRKITKKSKLHKPKPLTLKLDPDELRYGLELPKLNYEIEFKANVEIEPENVYKGEVLPLPKPVIYMLNQTQLLIFSLILEEQIKNGGECELTVIDMATIMNKKRAVISNTLFYLRQAGLLKERQSPKRGNGRIRRINFRALQKLNDLVEGEDIGVYARIRKATKKIDLMKLNKADIHNSYDNKVLPPVHDEADEEEYD